MARYLSVHFELTTVTPGDGAVPGRHQAIVSAPLHRPGRGGGWAEPPKPQSVNALFGEFDTSPLEFTVTDDASANRFDIVVTE
jgi:hypothetical protein